MSYVEGHIRQNNTASLDIPEWYITTIEKEPVLPVKQQSLLSPWGRSEAKDSGGGVHEEGSRALLFRAQTVASFWCERHFPHRAYKKTVLMWRVPL
jgi:hypothetical protein